MKETLKYCDTRKVTNKYIGLFAFTIRKDVWFKVPMLTNTALV